MESRHQAIAAGLALSLAFGAAVAPATAFATASTGEAVQDASAASASGDGAGEGSPSGDADGATAAEELPAPSGWDRADNYESAPADTGSIMMLSLNSLLSSRSSTRITPTALSSEMKYFAQNESGSNYRLGFSYGDGYNAMGFYQFDRRYSLVDFMQACYDYDSSKYAMFAPVIARADELRTGEIYDRSAKRLTEIGQLAQGAWYAAYDQDPAEFSALQDNYGYQAYYLPVERILRNSFGLDISGRADCVKGLAWGMCNLFGSGGCQKYFRLANLSEDMSDREVVNALCDAVVKNVGGTYAQSYRNRYERERATCLAYLDQHDAEAEQDGDAATQPETQPGDQSDEQGDSADGDAPADTPSDDVVVPDAPSNGGVADDDAQSDGGSADAPSEDDGAGDSGSAGDDTTAAPDGDHAADGEGSGSEAEPDSGAGDASGSDQGSSSGQTAPTPVPPSNGDASQGDSSSSGSDDADDKVNTGNGATGENVLPPSSDATGGNSNSSQDGSTSSSQQNQPTSDAGQSGSESKDEGDTTTGGDTGSGDRKGGDDKTSDDREGKGGDSKSGDANTEKLPGSSTEPERLPATADAASIAMVVSAGMSAVGTAVAVAGKRLGGKKIPFEDGFRE